MKSNYSDIYDAFKKLLRDNIQKDVTIKESHGARLAPWTDIITRNGKKEYVIYYNPCIEVLLSLFNNQMLKGNDCTKALIEFLLYHSYMQQDDYENAEVHLEAFHAHTREMGMDALPADIRSTDKFLLGLQVMFILMHETSHICIAEKQSIREEEMGVSRMILSKMTTSMDFGFDGSGAEDAMRKNSHIMSVFDTAMPDVLTEEDREDAKQKFMKDFSVCMNYPKAIKKMLEDNDVDFMEEIACDRMAWVNVMARERMMGADKDMIYSFHLMLYIALNTVDFIKAQQLTYSPREHAKREFDMLRVTLRHMAFTDVVWQTCQDIDEYDTDDYNDITLQFQSIGILANKLLGNTMTDIFRLYGNDRNDTADLNIAVLKRIESKLESIAAEII